MYAIEVKNLMKSYGKTAALKGVSFDVKKGELFGLLGANGAGKSTTINILAGVLSKDSGEIKILGQNPEEVKDRMNVGSAYLSMTGGITVEQNLRVFGRLYKVKDLNKKIEQLLKQFQIYDLRKKKTYTLSSGEQTRAILCKALINDPEILLLDECTVGLDPDIAQQTRKIIQDFQRDSGSTILFTSHYMFEVEQLCDRIAFLNDGKIVMIDTPAKLKEIIQNQIVEIEFINPAKDLVGFIKSKNVKVLSSTKNKVVFEVSAVGDKLYKVLNRLFQKGYKIKDMSINKPTLEEVFIKIARKQK